MSLAVAERPLVDVPALDDASGYRLAFCSGMQPDPVESIDEFADAHIKLPSHSAVPGDWETDRTPFLREIMQCLSPHHPCREVALIKPTQIGGTQLAVNWLGYTIARSPSAFLFCEPTKELAKNLSEGKVEPMLTDSPIFRGLVQDVRARDSKNRTLSKRFRGGFVHFIGTNSAVGLRHASAPRIVMDEVDAYLFDVDDEGHPCKILEKRAAAFFFYKLFKLSTPGVADRSMIEPAYEAGSRGRYHVPCPFCFHLQPLEWANLVFTFDGVKIPDRAAYKCAGCGELIPERYKVWMFADRGREGVLARWVHERPDHPVRTFHLNLLYQPFGWGYPWARLVKDFLEANEKAKAGDVRDLKTFTNTVLAETWEEQGEKADADLLYQRREVYEAPCPAGVLVLTAAVDVQDDRLEAEVCGWGIGEESWSIAYGIFKGSPSLPQVWLDLTEWLQRSWTHADEVAMRVEAVSVDTGGHHTKEAYRFVRNYRGLAFAIKGSNQPGAPIVPIRRPKHRHFRLDLHHIGTIAAKDTLFPRLQLAAPGPGYLHFPLHTDAAATPFRQTMAVLPRPGIPHDHALYDQEYFAQLAGSEKRVKYERGIEVGSFYKKTRSRNEALDIKVYNLATLHLWLQRRQTTLERLAAEWDMITARAKVRQLTLPSTEDSPAAPPMPIATVAPVARGRRVISQGVS